MEEILQKQESAEMFILVACEESQVVCKAFRAKGHFAFSCDIIDCSGGHPEWHIKGDVIPLLNGRCSFKTCDGITHKLMCQWDMIIAFPPCTFLCNTGNRWFNIERYGNKAIERLKKREAAIEFFMTIANADCEKIIIENPVGVMSTRYRKPNQIIHPYYFAVSEDDENRERKATCLWLKGVKPLTYTIKYKPRLVQYQNGKGVDSVWHYDTLALPHELRAKLRSRTFNGIGNAMAEQWG